MSKTLAEQTRQTAQEFIDSLPDEVRQTVGEAMQRLMSSDVAGNARQIGDTAPDFSLPDVRGGQGQLADFLAHGPVVLSFYRGGWCPFCNLEFKALADILPAINAAGATLVGISPERPEVGQQTVADHGLEFEVLSDVGNLVIRDYGLLMRVDEQMRPHYRQWGIDLFAANGDESYELPVPATYVIDRDGVIRAAHVDRDYTSRMEPADILAALDSI